jgi:phosphohistidine phosphatase
MKTLYLVRHAKASWDDQVNDWERPLTEIGVERAHKVAKALKAKKIKPSKIISSYAFRALNTAVIFAMDLRYPATKIEVSQSIYEKRAIDILDMLRKQDDKDEIIMLFGHYPAITELYNMLTRKLLLKLSTSSTAGIQFNIKHWKDLGNTVGKTLFIEPGK